MVTLLLFLLACRTENELDDQDPTKDGSEPIDTGTIDPTRHDADHDGTVDAEDCAPTNIDIHPAAAEQCDDVDNDCDGKVDESFDADDDGFLDQGACYKLPGVWDCDDEEASINPEAVEVCNGLDDDCDGQYDEIDADGDGANFCYDCDDTDPFVFFGAAEACDAIDNDCDGQVDELWDQDEDGWSPCNGDCDDNDAGYNPEAVELCDGGDNNCDGAVDETSDLDRDGVATCAGDCDDTDPNVMPQIAEVCDGKDTDCDPTTNEDVDLDGDGYTLCTGDCEDGSAAALPGGSEVCDSYDNDCNGYKDEDPSCWSCSDSGSYRVCTTSTEWDEAKLVCESFGMTLAMISNTSENDTVTDLTISATWIGLSDQAVEGDYLWVDGSPMGYDSWGSSEPTGSASEDCVILNNGGRRGDWADVACTASYKFVCEW